ncbi:hypothetical protein E8E13_000111 [Curvularia kusanoi]|uniref:DUF7708 domain-containing protein n=1 Tax=Curvularia kusanoi TaxID=90978 RepID=A0A9P4W7Q2_CURKU|nr:hypothetical protein E8E13_000111 [Curvularia kusanoi]
MRLPQPSPDCLVDDQNSNSRFGTSARDSIKDQVPWVMAEHQAAAASQQSRLRADRSQQVGGWYGGSSQISLEDLIESTFQEGKQACIDELSNSKDEKGQIIFAQTTMKDVIITVQSAQDSYSAKRNSKAWRWLTQLSTRINHYGSILDVMVQHHPEYAALAWGAMKILFVGIENHEESVRQLSKALCQFADCLPRQELKLVLYPSSQMQRAVAKLYAKLINFMIRVMRWYQKSRPKRAIGAVFKPFALDFEEELNEVNELSRSVDEIASAAAQAEIRAVHAKVDEANAELTLVRLEIQRLGELVTQEASRAFQIASCTQSLSSQIQLDVRSHSDMFRTVQLNQIISAPFMADIPSSGLSLNHCSTFSRRNPVSITLSPSEIDILRDWSTNAEISYLILETRDHVYGNVLQLDLLRQIQSAKRPIIWSMRFPEYLERNFGIGDILRTLVLHALEINSDCLARQDFPITLASLRAASCQDDWLAILDRSLAGFEDVYMVVDSDILRFAAEDNACAAADLLLALGRKIKSTRLKIVASSSAINRQYFAQHSAAGSWKAIRTNDEQRRRLTKTKRQHLARIHRMRRL